MTKPRFTPDPAPEGTDPELVEFVQREFERMDDLWPDDLESRLEALETTWPYLTGTWPIIDIASVGLSTNYEVFQTLRDPVAAAYIFGPQNIAYYDEDRDCWDRSVLGTGGYSVFAQSGDGRAMAFGNSGCIYNSDVVNDSWSWRSYNIGFTTYVSPKIAKAHYDADTDGWYLVLAEGSSSDALGTPTLIRSTDNGLNWTVLSRDSGHPTKRSTGGFCARDPNYWVWSLGHYDGGSSQLGYIRISTDKGVSWSESRWEDQRIGGGPTGSPIRLNNCKIIWAEDQNSWAIVGRYLGNPVEYIAKKAGEAFTVGENSWNVIEQLPSGLSPVAQLQYFRGRLLMFRRTNNTISHWYSLDLGTTRLNTPWTMKNNTGGELTDYSSDFGWLIGGDTKVVTWDADNPAIHADISSDVRFGPCYNNLWTNDATGVMIPVTNINQKV